MRTPAPCANCTMAEMPTAVSRQFKRTVKFWGGVVSVQIHEFIASASPDLTRISGPWRATAFAMWKSDQSLVHWHAHGSPACIGPARKRTHPVGHRLPKRHKGTYIIDHISYHHTYHRRVRVTACVTPHQIRGVHLIWCAAEP